MKKAILVIATLLIGLAVKNVYANTIRPYVVSDIFDNWAGIKIYNWTSSTAYTELTLQDYNYGYINETMTDSDNGDAIDTRINIAQADISNVGSNGITVSISTNNTFITNTIYETAIYYCVQNNVNLTLDNISIGTSWTPFSQQATLPITFGNTGLTNGVLKNNVLTAYSNCRVMKGYFTTAYEGNVLAIKLKSSSTSGWFVFAGTITRPIKASDYATKSDVNSLRTGITNSIDQQTQQQQENHEETMDVLTEDHNYNSNASETIEGQDDMDDMSEAENDLMGELDFSGAQDLEITINPHASQYIWQIVERLRTLPGVTILMTSILGLGIIKMILNR